MSPPLLRPVGEGVLEVRIHHGPGYRVYSDRRGETVYLRQPRRREVDMTDGVRIEPGDADVAPLDISELLDTPEAVAGFLLVAFEEGSTQEILGAIGHAAKASCRRC